jgi:murein DD-endopeptidase MepM/ murein hydrolase activator NlpD
MKKLYIILIIILILVLAAFLVFKQNQSPAIINQAVSNYLDNLNNQSMERNRLTILNDSIFQFPLDRAGERVTEKPFGIYITPQNSPVQPERFSGYHTGVDFETFPDEQNKDIEIKAICSGQILVKRYVSGYGGAMVEACKFGNQDIKVIYGHLKISSMMGTVGQELLAGDKIGVLGKGFSQETDYERKHLHLGIHLGKSVSFLGYVQNKAELANWLDVTKYFAK